MRTLLFRSAAAALVMTLAAPTLAHAQEPAPCSAPKPKKKGFGLGGLLSAAKRAGVGDMLTGRAGNMFGSGKGGQVLGAVTGTALNAAQGGQGEMGGMGGLGGSLASLGGSGTAGQIAGVVTSTVVQAASAAGTGGCGAN